MVLGDDPSTAAAPGNGAAAGDRGAPEMICRRELVLGSHMQRKVCRTREEIEAERKGAQSVMRDLREGGGRRETE